MIVVYNMNDMKKLQEEVNGYHRENNQQIKQHFKKNSYSFFPTFKLVARFASILFVVFLVGKQIIPQSYSEAPKPTYSPQDMVTDKAGSESLGLNIEKPIRVINHGIYTVIEQKESSTKKGYDIVLQQEDEKFDYFSTDELILNQPYYFENNKFYLARYENSLWSYQIDNTWYKVNP